MTVSELDFGTACKLAVTIGIVREDDSGCQVTLYLKDGSRLVFSSHYDGPYSNDTPGNGIESPSVVHKRD